MARQPPVLWPFDPSLSCPSPLPSYPVQLWLEIEGKPGRAELPGGGSALVAFMSFAVSRGFGATHPLIALADRLHDQHGVRLGALTTFYEAEAEDAEDRAKLELAWQAPTTLRADLDGLARAFAEDPTCATLARRGEASSLPEEAAALRSLLDGLDESARVRLVYAL